MLKLHMWGTMACCKMCRILRGKLNEQDISRWTPWQDIYRWAQWAQIENEALRYRHWSDVNWKLKQSGVFGVWIELTQSILMPRLSNLVRNYHSISHVFIFGNNFLEGCCFIVVTVSSHDHKLKKFCLRSGDKIGAKVQLVSTIHFFIRNVIHRGNKKIRNLLRNSKNLIR